MSPHSTPRSNLVVQDCQVAGGLGHAWVIRPILSLPLCHLLQVGHRVITWGGGAVQGSGYSRRGEYDWQQGRWRNDLSSSVLGFLPAPPLKWPGHPPVTPAGTAATGAAAAAPFLAAGAAFLAAGAGAAAPPRDLLAGAAAALAGAAGGGGGAASAPSTASSCSLILELVSWGGRRGGTLSDLDPVRPNPQSQHAPPHIMPTLHTFGMCLRTAGPTRSCTSFVTRTAALRTCEEEGKRGSLFQGCREVAEGRPLERGGRGASRSPRGGREVAEGRPLESMMEAGAEDGGRGAPRSPRAYPCHPNRDCRFTHVSIGAVLALAHPLHELRSRSYPPDLDLIPRFSPLTSPLALL